MPFKRSILGLMATIALSAGLTGCDAINPKEEIPAYIHIDSIALKDGPDNASGTISHGIQDAWVLVDNKFIGVFQLPATIPILKEGPQEVVVRAGIKNNGISNTRGPYPFYDTILMERNLEPKKVDSLGTLTTNYIKSAEFRWVERFEDTGNVTLRNNENASVPYELTNNPQEVFNGKHSLKADFEKEGDFFEVKLRERQAIQFGGKQNSKSRPQSIYMEVNFNTNIQIKVGLIAIAPNGNTTQRSKVILNETNGKWTKIYINFLRNIQRFPEDHRFQVFFGKVKRSAGPATTYLDNIKLITQ